MFHLNFIGWVLGVAGALLIGLSKTGIAGIGILAVILFAFAFPAKASTGIVLPVLISCDIIAVASFRRHVVWSHLFKLIPAAAVGVVIGYFALHRVNDTQVAHMIGGISVALVGLHVWRARQTSNSGDEAGAPMGPAFAAVMGILAGFATMVANGAGPIMVIYLLATGLPKMEFMGTGAIFYFLVNCLKVPFSGALGLINTRQSLPMDAIFAPIAIAGAVGGRILLPRLKQELFENAALALTVVAGIDMLFRK